MTQAVFSQKTRYSRVPFSVIKEARDGDVEAMTLIGRHFDPYIRKLATINVSGTSYLNTDLYDRLKTRLIMVTLNFQL